MEVEWSCYGGGQFKGGRIIVTEVASLKEGERSSYTGGQFNRVMLQRLSLTEGEWSCYRSGRFNGSGQFK